MTLRIALPVLIPIFIYACSTTTQKPTEPSGLYLKVYAMQFVEAMRGSDVKAGAFDISKQPEKDATYHLGIDVVLEEKTERLTVKLSVDARGLKPVHAALGSTPVYPDPTREWKQIDAWHSKAAELAAQE